jgi:transposase
MGEAGDATLGTARSAHHLGLHLRRNLPAGGKSRRPIIAIPSKCPELNPQENIWQFMRDNWLSNRVFGSYDEIVDHCCDAWNKLVEQPWRITSIGMRKWAQGF